MGFVDDKSVKTGGGNHKDVIDDFSSDGKTYSSNPNQNKEHPMFPGDSQSVVHFFEVGSSQWAEEDYAWAPHYRDVYSTENFSRRVQEQINTYPGMHNTDMGLKSPYTRDPNSEDPWAKNGRDMGESQLNYWNAAMDNPQSFMSGLQQKQKSFDYSQMFDNKDDFKKNAAALITECIPCFDRLFDGAQLLPDGDLLELHLLNINLRTDLLDKLKELLANPGLNINICELLKMFAHLCPQDLLAILALLTQYLAKLNLDFKFNLDLIIELIGPILSPFLDALGGWLDKWVQAILAPVICVVDHINMTMYMAQQMRLPLSESSIDLDYDTGIATPTFMGGNSVDKATDDWMWAHGQSSGGIHTGFDGKENPYMEGYMENEAFDTPDDQLYNPEPPVPPIEEWEYGLAEAADAVGDKRTTEATGYDKLAEEEREALFLDLQSRRQRQEIGAGRGIETSPRRNAPSDGSRWSTNDIPLSEKKSWGKGFSKGQVPANQQAPKQAQEYTYLNADAIVDPIIQMRNIIQGGIAYIQDWFEYVVQLIYDLLGTDFGWMKKKMDQTVLKSRIIQLIYMIIAVIDAFMSADLKCGVNTNLNPAHMDFMLGTAMNRLSPFKFIKQPDGTFEVIPPGKAQSQRDPEDLTQKAQSLIDDTADLVGDSDKQRKRETAEQKAAKSGIIIKDCLKKVSADDLSKVKQWIRDFERRSNPHG